MKVAIDGRDIRSDVTTGIGRWTRTFANHASRLAPDWSFFLYPLKGSLTVWEDQVSLPLFLRKSGIDFFLNPYPKSPLILPCPMMTIVHDLIPLCAQVYQTRRYFFARTLFKNALSVTIKRSHRILAISERTKKDLVTVLGIPEEKICVVYLGMDTIPLSSKDPGYLEKRYKGSLPYILYVGNFLPHKNISALLRAYANLNNGLRERYSLLLVGKKDSYARALERQARSLGIAQRTFFSGAISEEDLPWVYRQASLFVFPSFYEGFGLPPLEAMAYGIPVAASNLTSLPEVLGDASVPFDPTNVEEMTRAMEEVLSDPSLGASLSEKGLKRARLFTGEKMSRDILDVLKRV